VFTQAFDLDSRAAVWLFSGASNQDADFEAYIRSIRELAVRTRGAAQPAVVMLVDAENPAPSAVWRRRIAEASGDIGEGALFALVSERALIRGIVVAINWLRPPRYEPSAHASFDEGVRWVEARRGESLAPLFDRLLREARRATRGPRSEPA
jgi:hypothetical protein